MKITMLSTQNGSVDGIRVKEYTQGVTYDLTDSPGARSLAAAFVGAAMAVEVAPSEAVEIVATVADPEVAPVAKPEKTGKRK